MQLKKPELEFAFSMELEFPPQERIRFQPDSHDFTRGFVAVAGGKIWGPMLNGRVVAGSGGDWPRIWKSGLFEFEAHYMLEAEDGTPIYIHNCGIAFASPDTIRMIEQGQHPTEAPYCRITPRFEAPQGPYGWLNKKIIVGTSERRGNKSVFDYYVVN